MRATLVTCMFAVSVLDKRRNVVLFGVVVVGLGGFSEKLHKFIMFLLLFLPMICACVCSLRL